MSTIYSISIRLMQFGFFIGSLFNSKARALLEGRKNLFKLIKAEITNDQRPRAWFHCASLGEFEQGRPVIEQFKNVYPEYAIVLTFFSPSGYEVRKKYDKADYVFYLPFDTPKNAEKFVHLISPSIVFFVKYEFWHHLIHVLKKNEIPVISFSAIFRNSQLFFRPFGGFYRDILRNFDHIFVQNQHSLELLKKIDLSNTSSLAGDTRFDRVYEAAKNVQILPKIEHFKGNNRLMVIGSSWKEDLDIVIPFINSSTGEKLRFIIAPHEIHEKDIEKLILRLNGLAVCYSNFTIEESSNADVLVIDNVGLLLSIYQYADIAYIGGAFGKGLHNILEAAAYGTPIVFGNKSFSKFQEAIDLKELGCAFPINSTSQMAKVIEEFEDDAYLDKTRSKCIKYIEENLGATQKIIDYTKTILSERASI